MIHAVVLRPTGFCFALGQVLIPSNWQGGHHTGVLVLNASSWHKERIFPRLLQYFKDNHQYIRLCDQDAMNAVFRRVWGCLNTRWHVLQDMERANNYSLASPAHGAGCALPGFPHLKKRLSFPAMHCPHRVFRCRLLTELPKTKSHSQKDHLLLTINPLLIP